MRLNYILLFAIGLVAIVIISGCAQSGEQQTSPTTTTTSTITQPTATAEITVEITSSGFSPKILTINAGDTVVFANKDANAHWPASAFHPTHAVYPESGGCIGSKFDSCKGLNEGEMFSFRFDNKGTWRYHDHLDPSLTGTIIVE